MTDISSILRILPTRNKQIRNRLDILVIVDIKPLEAADWRICDSCTDLVMRGYKWLKPSAPLNNHHNHLHPNQAAITKAHYLGLL